MGFVLNKMSNMLMYSKNIIKLITLIIIAVLNRLHCIEECGVPYKKLQQYNANARIVGSTNAKRHSYPWMALIMARGLNIEKKIEDVRCGGTIINNEWLLSSASCIDFGGRKQMIFFNITLGEQNTNWKEGFEVTVKAEQVLVHDDYDPVKLFNDIALIKMDTTLDFKDKHKHLGAICLSERNKLIGGQYCEILGWGQTVAGHQNKQQYSNMLRVAQIPIRQWTDCLKKWGKLFDPTVNICAGHDSGKKDFCFGDGGGPLLCHDDGNKQFIQYGVASHGHKLKCGIENLPSIYTKVVHYLSWISGITGLKFNTTDND